VSPPTQRSGAPPPGERPASNDPSRHYAAGPAQDNPPARPAVADVSAMDRAPFVPRQLHRRRAAAYRCPPRPDRRRDPLDPATVTTARTTTYKRLVSLVRVCDCSALRAVWVVGRRHHRGVDMATSEFLDHGRGCRARQRCAARWSR
jgi:hypothetical protein